MAAVDLVYCADGNRRFAEIAVSHGFRYGARLPARGLPFAPWFADQDWKKPNRQRYMTELAKHRPHMATVLDLERAEQLDEVLGWADEAAQYVQVVLIIPKVSGIIESIPRRIGNAEVRLAYSVPTRYGGTDVPSWEFTGWPVHLLGGSPHSALRLRSYLDVRSVDGNYHNLLATRFAKYWQDGREKQIQPPRMDAMYDAFEQSCINIMAAWRT